MNVDTSRIGITYLTKTEAFDIIKNKCSDWDYNDLPIYRGTNLKSNEFALIEPDKRIRKSAFAVNNIYTTLIDNSPYWEEYPKRSKSLICSFDKGYAETYSTAYRVIPFNNSNWGVCVDDDIWHSFFYIIYDIYGGDFTMNMFNESIRSLIPDEYNNHKFTHEDDIIYSLKNTNKNNIIVYPESDKFSKYIFDNIEKYDNLYDLLIDITEPVKNKFKLLDYNSLIKSYNKIDNDHEVWSDSTCILVRDDILILIMNNLYNDNYMNENKIITKFKYFNK